METNKLKTFDPDDVVEILEHDDVNGVMVLMRNGVREEWTYAEFSQGGGVDLDIVPPGTTAARKRC